MAPRVDDDIKDCLRQVYEAVRQCIFMVKLPDTDNADFFHCKCSVILFCDQQQKME